MAAPEKKTAPDPTVPEKTILDLTTLLPAAVVRIDRIEYALRSADAMPLLAYRRYDQLRLQINDLLGAENPTIEQEEELTRKLDAQCRMVLEAPDAVHARLTDSQRLAILVDFAELPASTRRTPVATKAQTGGGTTRRSTGASSSRSSSGSTGATRSAGS